MVGRYVFIALDDLVAIHSVDTGDNLFILNGFAAGFMNLANWMVAPDLSAG